MNLRRRVCCSAGVWMNVINRLCLRSLLVTMMLSTVVSEYTVSYLWPALGRAYREGTGGWLEEIGILYGMWLL
jgi:hypothetical protein